MVNTHPLKLRHLNSPNASEHHAVEIGTHRVGLGHAFRTTGTLNTADPTSGVLPHGAQVAVAAGEVLTGLGLLEPGSERGRAQQRPLLVVVLHDEHPAGAQQRD